MEDIDLPLKSKNKSSINLTVKDLDSFMDTFPSISQEHIYNFESEDINLYIFADKNIHFIDVNKRINLLHIIRKKEVNTLTLTRERRNTQL